MKRSESMVGLAVLMCLAAGSATLVFGQLSNTGSTTPVAAPDATPSPKPVAPPSPSVTLPPLPTTPEEIATPKPANMPAVRGDKATCTDKACGDKATLGGARSANSNKGEVPTSVPHPPPPAPVKPPQPMPSEKSQQRPQAQLLQLPKPEDLQVRKAPVAVPEKKGTTLVGIVLPEPPGPGESKPIVHNHAATVGNPDGHQEPAVSLEWIGPPTARLNQNTAYQIVAKNISSAPVTGVTVRYRIPEGVRITGKEPQGQLAANILSWELGELLPSQEKKIDLQLVPEAKAAISCQATVTFTGASTLKVQVREPKLVLTSTAPERVVLGEAASLSVTVCNPGDGTADHVKIKAVMPEGLENARGKTFELDVGSLAPGDSRTVQLVCLARSAGVQQVECVALADAGLCSQNTAKVDVVLARLDLAMSGPKLRYLDRHATYVLTVTNSGSAPASNVSVVHQLPPGFKFAFASHGGRHDFAANTVTWFIGDLTPGESREVTVEAAAASIGEHRHKAVATAARGLRAESEAVTQVDGLSALLMELVDTDDPIEVGAETSYQVRVTNTGSKTETNLELVCTVPDKMEFREAKCAAGCKYRVEGKEIIFEPLPQLAPRADVLYRVVVRGIAPGDLRFRARIRADGLSEPVLQEESTKVYGDEVPPR